MYTKIMIFVEFMVALLYNLCNNNYKLCTIKQNKLSSNVVMINVTSLRFKSQAPRTYDMVTSLCSLIIWKEPISSKVTYSTRLTYLLIRSQCITLVYHNIDAHLIFCSQSPHSWGG
jgi:hypothetical protein